MTLIVAGTCGARAAIRHERRLFTRLVVESSSHRTREFLQFLGQFIDRLKDLLIRSSILLADADAACQRVGVARYRFIDPIPMSADPPFLGQDLDWAQWVDALTLDDSDCVLKSFISGFVPICRGSSVSESSVK